jgi:hypothetical protein
MKIQDGKLVVKDGKAACECCGGDDDWLDELDPTFPGPNGSGSGPDPEDPVCCDCDPEVNLTRCTNCWDDETDVVFDGNGFVLSVERRVRVALRFVASLRLFAEKVNGSGVVTDTYDVDFPINIILDSEPPNVGVDPDGFCGAQAVETVEGDGIVSIGGRDFVNLYTISLVWNTEIGFFLEGTFVIGPTDPAFTGGFAVGHEFSVTGVSGATVTDGIIITNTSSTENEQVTGSYTIPMGTCQTRNTQEFGGLSAESRSPPTGQPFVRSITELTNLSIDMVVGNVFPCS